MHSENQVRSSERRSQRPKKIEMRGFFDAYAISIILRNYDGI